VVLSLQKTSFTPPDEDPKKTTSTTYTIGPTVTMRSGSGKISYDISGGLGFGRHSAKKEGETTTAETNLSYFEGGGGLSYHISEAVSFDVGMRYRKSTFKMKDPIDPKVTTSTDSSGLIFGVGFALYFGGR
jgi:opacity protein-like surface antigen